MPATILTGLQWGDEGKGKMVDHLSGTADAVARFSGGANAGHTVETGGRRIALHQLPSGLIHPDPLGIIGAGCVLDPAALMDEIKALETNGISISDRFSISGKVHLVHPAGKYFERKNEGERGVSAIGTTYRGIGPTYVRKFMRKGIRLEDAAMPDIFLDKSALITEDCLKTLDLSEDEIRSLNSEVEIFNSISLKLVEYAEDVSLLLARILDNDGSVIAEGAQGTLLDPDHGTYPFVTCGSCVAGAACSSLGIGPVRIDDVVGVMKAYSTRVRNGPFPTELT